MAGRRRQAWLLSTALTIVTWQAAAQPAPNARPSGGQVVAGGAAISQANPTSTVITQSTDRAAINWQSFSVGSQQSVDFQQPSAGAVTLNRVTGPDPSAIAGQIHANGGVVLTNPNGVVFSKGAQVNASEIIVSTAGITNQNFMAGRMVFDQPGNANATITNAGTITVKDTGLAALVAPQVANSGVISAHLGHAVLAGAEAATLDMYGDGLLAVDVTKQVTHAPAGGAALVTNTGTILADGGNILLTAQAADGVVQNLVAAGGKLSADSVGEKTGAIAIAGTGGSIVITGHLSAMGLAAGTGGGTIEVNADKAVTVAASARINASGAAGGGTVAVGTNLARAIGGASVTAPAAASTTVAKGAKILANANRAGNGGRVTVLSSQTTAMHGLIQAKGGPTAGNGGSVEVSGPVLTLDGSVDVTAAHGALGDILLDPGTLDITANPPGATLTPGTTASNVTFDQGGTVGTSYLTPAQIEALSGNIELDASADINVQSAVVLAGSTQQLTLQAGGNLTVSAPITAPGGMTLVAGSTSSPTPNPAATLSVQADLNVTNAAISLTSQGTGGIVLNANVNAGASQGVVEMYSSGPITQTGGIITAGYLAGNGTSISLTNANLIPTVLNLTATTGSISLTEAPGQSLAINGAVTVANGQGITLTADSLSFGGEGSYLYAPNGNITLRPATAGLPILLSGYNVAYRDSIRRVVSRDAGGTLTLSGYNLFEIRGAETLTIGGTNSGPITIGSQSNYIVVFGNTLALNSGGLISQVGTLAVGALTGSALGVTLATPGNSVPVLGGFTVSGSPTSSFTLATGGSLSVTGPVRATSSISLSAGQYFSAPLILGSSLDAATVSLNAAGQISQTAGTIGATVLTAYGRLGTSLTALNQVATLGNVGGQYAIIRDAAPLTVAGYVGSGATSVTLNSSGALSIAAGATVQGASDVELDAGGALTEDPAARIVTTELHGTAGTIALLGTSNAATVLAGFSIPAGGGDFALTDVGSLIVAGSVSVPTGQQISITTDTISFSGSYPLLNAPGGGVTLAPLTSGRKIEVIGSGNANTAALSLTTAELSAIATGTLTLGAATTGNINLGNVVPAGGGIDRIDFSGIASTLHLVSAGTITEGNATTYGTTAGGLTVTNLSGTAARVLLPADNLIGTLGAFASSGPFFLNDTEALTVSGPVTGSSIRINDSGGPLSLAGTVSAPTLSLYDSGGAITQIAGGLTASALSASATGVTIGGAGNTVTATGFLDASAGDITLVNQGSLTIGGSGAFATGNVLLGAAGDILISTQLSTGSAGALKFQATGTVSDVSPGAVSAGTLTGTAGALTLTQNPTFSVLGDFTAGTIYSVAPAGDFEVSGTISAPTVFLNGRGGLTLAAGNINGTAITLGAVGSVIETGGSLTGGTLSALSQSGSIALTSPTNAFAAIRTASAPDGISIFDGQALDILAPIGAGAGPLTLGVTGSLAIGGALTAPAGITLTATGAITEPAPGLLTTDTLTVSGASVALGNTLNAVGTLASGSASSGGFAFADSLPLTLTGLFSAGTGGTLALTGDTLILTPSATLSAPGGVIDLGPALPTDAFTLSNGGSLSPSIIAGTVAIASTLAASVTLDGVLDFSPAATLSLNSGGGGITETAATVLSAATLVGTSLGPVSLTGSNSIAALGSFASTGGFSLTDARALTVAGSLTDSAAIDLDVTGGDLTLSGVLTAPQTSLTASAGAITQTTGGLVTGTLSARALTAITLDGPANGITATTLIAAGSSATLIDQTDLTIGGQGVSATDFLVSAAGDIGIAAAIRTANTVTLQATGTVTEVGNGAISTGTLSGTAAGVVLGGNNDIAELGPFTATGGFSLTDLGLLTVTGPVSAGVSIAIGSQYGLTIAGGLTAPQVSLSAGTGYYVVPERLTSDFNSTTPAFITQTTGSIAADTAVTLAAAGAITQSGGSIVTPLLLVEAGGTVSLPGPGNAIATLGSATSTGGFLLQDGIGLTLAGPVGDTALVTLGVAGTLAVAGSLTAPSVYLTATGAITEPGGLIATATLAGSGAGVSLGAANTVGTLVGFSSTGNFLLADSQALTVAGTVAVASGGTLTLADGQPSFAAAAVLSAPAGTVVLAPADAGAPLTLSTIGGSVIDAATLVVGSASAGSISLAGALDFAAVPLLDLVSGAAVTQNSGSLTVGTLTGSAAAISLAGTNAIGTLSALTATGAFALQDGIPLTLTGPLSAASVSLAAPGQAITESGGGIAAGTLAATASSLVLGGANTVATAGSLVATAGALVFADSSGLTLAGGASAAGPVTLTSGGSLALGGPVSGPAVTLAATGAVTQTASGPLVAGTLSVSAASATLTGTANTIGNLGSVTTAGGFSLTDQTSLTLSGPVTDSTGIVLGVTGSLALAGNITAPTLNLSASGGITQSAGTVTAGLLSGTAGGAVSLTGVDAIGTLGAFASNVGFTLADGQALTVTGPVSDSASLALSVTGDLVLASALTAPTVGLTASGSIDQTAGSITATVLGGSSGAAVTLGQTNAVGTLSGFSGSGNFLLTDSTPLTAAGTNAVASGFTLAINDDTLAFAPGALLSAPAGAVALGPATTGDPIALTAATTGHVATGTLIIGAATAGAITIGGSFDFSTTPVADLISGAGITESSAAGLNVPTLSVNAASATLTGSANTLKNLGSVTTAGGFSLTDQTSLTLSGPVTDSTGIMIAVTGSLALAGNIAAPTLNLSASGGIIQSAGTVTAGLLSGTAGGAVSLTAVDAIGTLGPFASNGGFTLADGQALTVTGPVTDSTSLALSVTGDLVLAGALTAPTVGLTASGGIDQTAGSITATVLGGSGGAAVTLGQANAVGTLSGFSGSGSFLLTDSTPLTAAGTNAVASGFTLAINDDTLAFAPGALLSAPAGAVALGPATTGDPIALTAATTGHVAAGTLVIGAATAGAITIGGSFDFSTTPVVDLISGAGITESSAAGLNVPTLSVSAASATLTGSANTIGNLGSVAVTGAFSLADQTSLTTGPVAAGTTLSLATTGSLTLDGSLTAPAVVLSATSGITQPGGTIDATLLLGSSSGPVSLAQANAIGTLGGFSGGGTFVLTDSIPLTVAGTNAVATGAALTLQDDAISFAAGALLSAPSGAVALAPATAGDPIALSAATIGHVAAGTLVIGTTTAGAITLAGSFDFSATPVLDLVSGADITQTGAAGLSAPTLSVNAASATLTGSANTIGNLGSVSVNGAFSLADQTSLTAGPVTAGTTLSLASTGSLTLDGSLTAPAVVLSATGGITQPGGAIDAAVLLGSSSGQVSLAQANAIGTLGGFSGGGTFVLTDSIPLTVTGTNAVATGATLTLQDDAISFAAGALLAAPSGAVALAPAAAGDPIALSAAAIGHVAAGTLVIGTTTAGAITLAGSFDFSATPVLDLVSGADITQTGGVTVATLTGTSAGAVALGGNNTISTLGSFSAGGSFALTDAAPLTVAGPLTASSVSLTDSAAITLTGSLATTALTITAGGTVLQSAGTIEVGLLTGSAVGLAQFGPDDPGPLATIGTLGAFSVTGGPLAIASGVPMVVTGPLAAASVTLSAPGSLTLAGGTIALSSAAASTIAATGIAPSLLQDGTTTITAPAGATLLFSAPDGSTQFASLAAPSVATSLNIGGGTATGTIDVAGLNLNATGGAATLFGIIGNVSGSAAALQVTFSGPGGGTYLLNGCQIAAVSCTTTVVTGSTSVTLPPTVFQPPPLLSFPLIGDLSLIPLLPPNLEFAGADEAGGQQQLETAKTTFRVPFLNGFVSFEFSRDIGDPDIVLPNVAEGDY